MKRATEQPYQPGDLVLVIGHQPYYRLGVVREVVDTYPEHEGWLIDVWQPARSPRPLMVSELQPATPECVIEHHPSWLDNIAEHAPVPTRDAIAALRAAAASLTSV